MLSSKVTKRDETGSILVINAVSSPGGKKFFMFDGTKSNEYTLGKIPFKPEGIFSRILG